MVKRGALGFSVLWFWLFFRSVFQFWWSLRFADFSFFSIWFSVFVNNTGGFLVLVPDVVFGFSYFVLFWVPVSVRFEQHLISNSRETPKLFRGMRTSRASKGRSNCGLCCVFLRGGKRRREFSKEKQV